MNIWWKVYFWIWGSLTLIGLISFGGLAPWTAGVWFEVVTSLLVLIGLYAYVFEKKMLSVVLWKTLFWLLSFSWTFNAIYMFTPLNEYFAIPEYLTSGIEYSGEMLIFAYLLTAPALWSIYKLAYQKTAVRKKK